LKILIFYNDNYRRVAKNNSSKQWIYQRKYFLRTTFAPMFRKLTAIFLLTAFVTQTFTGSLIRLDYYMNTAGYAQNCINKARPKMHCNGQCQMMKKLREEEKKEQENTERKYESKLTVLSSRSFYPVLQPGFSSLVSIPHFYSNDNEQVSMSRSFFHPPTV